MEVEVILTGFTTFSSNYFSDLQLLNGACPKKSSYMITPNDHISVFGPYFCYIIA